VIAVSTTGRTFAGLARYLLHGRTGREHDRVAWTKTHNLVLHDPERAARLMQATAAQNHRVEHPVYHLVVSFDPQDHPTPAIMRQVADRLLADLRLAEHQALVVAHKDRAHAHLHVVVNRVHPDSGRAWNPWQDFVDTQRTLRTLERELGLRPVEGRLHHVRSPGESGLRQSSMPPRRPSHDRDLSPERQPVVADAVARVRDLDLAHRLRDLRYHAEQRIDALTTRLSALRDSHTRALDSSRAFDAALAKAYVNPHHARKIFDAFVGANPAVYAEVRRMMTKDPRVFGDLRATKRPILVGLFHRRDDTPARTQAKHAGQLGVRAAVASEQLHQSLERTGVTLSRDHVDTYTRVVADLQGRLDAAKRELQRLDHARHVLPDERTLQRAAAHALRYVLPDELHRVTRWLTAPQQSLINNLRSMASDLAMGRERHVG
jgi:hypothetical protein